MVFRIFSNRIDTMVMVEKLGKKIFFFVLTYTQLSRPANNTILSTKIAQRRPIVGVSNDYLFVKSALSYRRCSP